MKKEVTKESLVKEAELWEAVKRALKEQPVLSCRK
jgi:hypothetical protein